jgi:LDH2 family malate/lactate/ureidoglycolate dehydrogenase
MLCGINELKQLTKDALLAVGFNEEDADISAEVLLYAEIRGNNQGLPSPIAFLAKA